jgi:nuclear control of ATPase protein 2
LDQGDLTKGLFSTHNESELSAQTLASITAISDNMKMSEVMRDYEKELSEPKSNLLMGNIVHLMLIQMQFMKKEIMVSMAKMDDVLKANHLLVNTMSTVPAFVVSYMGYNVLKQIYKRVFQDDKERRNSSIELRITLRDIDQCLNLVAHRSEVDVNGSEIFRMDLRDLGNLAMLLHRFDEQLNMYFIFGKVRPEIQYRMEEDMEELMMEDFSISQRMRVIERFYRSYDVFSSSFKKDFF